MIKMDWLGIGKRECYKPIPLSVLEAENVKVKQKKEAKFDFHLSTNSPQSSSIPSTFSLQMFSPSVPAMESSSNVLPIKTHIFYCAFGCINENDCTHHSLFYRILLKMFGSIFFFCI
jgi:hypothetical protein